jgi:uncharacterized membrane protein
MKTSSPFVWKKQDQNFVPASIALMIGLSSMILFACSSIRHLLFQSASLDLGYFDQATYLISQGLTPIVSFWGYHFMGGHADWVMYGIALLYKIYPSVYWLLAIQALSLAGGALPSWHLARQAGLSPKLSVAIALAYLLYPLVFNLNLFDFHPEVIALPFILWAIWAARADRIGWFTACVVLILGCRAALSLTIAAMGVWLIVFEKKRICGAIAVALGASWFVVATQVVIPHFRPGGVESLWRYAYLGNSIPEIVLNLVLKPGVILGRIFSLDSIWYLFIVFLPFAWGLSLRHLAPLTVALPTFVINILSSSPAQRDLVHQYSQPVVPFLVVSAIAGLAAGKTWLRQPRWIVLWSFIAFLLLGKYGFFWTNYLSRLSTWEATRAAIAQVTSKDPVLTTTFVAPHLTHRHLLECTKVSAPPKILDPYKYVLLNLQDPGWDSSSELATQIFQQVKNDSRFQLRFERDRVYLFVKSF